MTPRLTDFIARRKKEIRDACQQCTDADSLDKILEGILVVAYLEGKLDAFETSINTLLKKQYNQPGDTQ